MALVVERHGGALLVYPWGQAAVAIEPARLMCAHITAKPGTLPVLGAGDLTVSDMSDLAAWAHRTGSRPPALLWLTPLAADLAQLLSDLLLVTVVTPSGDVVQIPDGSLFVWNPHGGKGFWLEFTPEASPSWRPGRYPPPDWQPALAELPGLVLEPEFELTEIPAGLWLRPRGPVNPDDLAFSVLPDPDRVTVLLSRPGGPLVSPADVGRLVDALGLRLPAVVFAPYGQRVDNGQQLAACLGRPVNVQTGLMLRAPGGSGAPTPAAIGEDGLPSWHPFAYELCYLPGEEAPDLVEHRVLSSRLIGVWPGWSVQVIPAGLWLHRSVTERDARLAAAQSPDQRWCTLLVGGVERAKIPKGLVRHLAALLPPDAQRCLRVAELADVAVRTMAPARF